MGSEGEVENMVAGVRSLRWKKKYNLGDVKNWPVVG